MTILVKHLKLTTKSSESYVMMITAFLITFFNTAILNLMLTANFQESNYTFLKFLLYAGNRTDWDTKWYNEIGPLLIQTMLI